MERVVLIKYGELTTKKGNRKFFVNTLYQNMQKKLKDDRVKISRDLSRMYLSFPEEDLDKILKKLNEIFGIHCYQVAYQISNEIETIQKQALEIMKEKTGTFKVETKRVNKNFPIPSLDFSRQIGGLILKNNSHLTVDVHDPDTTLMIEILDQVAYLYTDKVMGLGGYPVGVQAKGMLMLSGGIDSPVSGYLALKRGIQLEAVYFEAIPHTSLEARNKVITLTKKLTKYTDSMKLHIVPFTEIQEEIYKKCNPEYGITIMRRMMYRITEKLAKRNKALAIINGESIGQVASQTLASMSVINSVINMPVIRPVACFDKLEIIEIAKKIDTYETSILPYEDCCTIFVPKHPVIHPTEKECIWNEEKLDVENLVLKTVENTKTITIREQENNEFQSLL